MNKIKFKANNRFDFLFKLENLSKWFAWTAVYGSFAVAGSWGKHRQVQWRQWSGINDVMDRLGQDGLEMNGAVDKSKQVCFVGH